MNICTFSQKFGFSPYLQEYVENRPQVRKGKHFYLFAKTTTENYIKMKMSEHLFILGLGRLLNS